MIKRDEVTFPDSCLNKANDDEMLFVLLARDPAAPEAIRAWIRERIRIGKNAPDDKKIQNAERCAAAMEASAPKSNGFIAGYEACEKLFFGPDVAADFNPTSVINPYRSDSDEHRGFEEAYYDFTQK